MFDLSAERKFYAVGVIWDPNQLWEKTHSLNTGCLNDLSSSGIMYKPMKELYVTGEVPEPVRSLPIGPRK